MSVTFFPSSNPAKASTFKDDINVSEWNAGLILSALRVDHHYKAGVSSIDEFINRGRNWLRENIGKTDAGELSSVDNEPSKATFIHCGRREGYLNERLHSLVVMAEKAKSQGATHIVWS